MSHSYLQLKSVLDDIDVAAIKTGMLANADIVRTVARTLNALFLSTQPPLVLDPVCVSTSGHTLLADSEHEALDALIQELIPLATLLTPNTTEAEALLLVQRQRQRRQFLLTVGEHADTATLRISIASIEDMLRASRELCALGPRAVLLKGGHVAHGGGGWRIADVEAAVIAATAEDTQVHGVSVECDGLVPHGANMEILFEAAAQDPAVQVRDVPVVVDVLCVVSGGGDGREGKGGGSWYTLFVRSYLDSTSTHGTGCTLSAALACALAHEEPRTHFHALLFPDRRPPKSPFPPFPFPLFSFISAYVACTRLQLSKPSSSQRRTRTTASPLHSRWAAATAR